MAPGHYGDVGAQECARQLWEDRVLCDLVIKCGPYTMSVHKVFLMSQSQFFRGCLSSQFAEGRTSIVELPEAEPEIIHAVIRYCYGLPFDDSRRVSGSTSTSSHAPIPRVPRETIPNLQASEAYEHHDFETFKLGVSPMEFALLVYIAAEQYIIPGLADVAASQFFKLAHCHAHDIAFTNSMRIVMTELPEHDKLVRPRAIDMVSEGDVEYMEQKHFVQLIHELPHLAVEMLSGLHKNSAILAHQKVTCRRCSLTFCYGKQTFRNSIKCLQCGKCV